jgi:hypothetical protein
MKHRLSCRKPVVINTDPQRRCYNGCHFSSETVWSDWDPICDYTHPATAHDSMSTFQEINPTWEYKIEETEP